MNIPLFAEPIAHIGSFPITNAYVNSSILMLGIVAFGFSTRKTFSETPKRLQAGLESLIEMLLEYFDQVTGDRARSKKFFPLIAGLFIFILCSNWMGLLPGTGTIGVWETVNGHTELIPFLRPANSDLNLTLAMAVVSVVASHFVGMATVGFFAHWNRFFQFGTVWKAVKTFKPMEIIVSLVEFVVGLIEMVSEVAKVISLSLRLFGNIFAGEVLITVISSIFAYVLPIPFMGLELIVGVVQALVFAMLSLVYLTILTNAPHDEGAHEGAHGEPLPAGQPA